MKLKIKVTKEILEKSKMCGICVDGKQWKHENALGNYITQNCAISLACQEIFPKCDVSEININNGSRESLGLDKKDWSIDLPEIAKRFIRNFDEKIPEERVKMNPIEFEVELNDDVLDCIDISSIDLSESKTLELVK